MNTVCDYRASINENFNICFEQSLFEAWSKLRLPIDDVDHHSGFDSLLMLRGLFPTGSEVYEDLQTLIEMYFHYGDRHV